MHVRLISKHMSSVCGLVSHCIRGPDEHKHNLRKPNHFYITDNTSFRHNYRHFFMFFTLSNPYFFKVDSDCADIFLMQAYTRLYLCWHFPHATCNRLYLCWHVLHASIQQAVPLLTFSHANIQQGIPVLTCPSCKHTTGYTYCPIPQL